MASGRVPKVMNTEGRVTLNGTPLAAAGWTVSSPDSIGGPRQTQIPASSDKLPERCAYDRVVSKDGILSRLLDDRGRLFGKVNIVDIVVLVVIVAVIVFAAVRMTGGGAVATTPVKVTFQANHVMQALVPGLQAKGTIKDTAGNVLGELQSVQAKPSLEELLTQDGQFKAFPSSTHSDISFVVLCQGTVTDSTAHIGQLAARVGAEVRIVGPGYEIGTVITNVVWGENALK